MKTILTLTCGALLTFATSASAAEPSEVARAFVDDAIAGRAATTTPTKERPLSVVIESGAKACRGLRGVTVNDAKKLAKVRACVKTAVDDLPREGALAPPVWVQRDVASVVDVMADRHERGIRAAAEGTHIYEGTFDTEHGVTRWFYVAVAPDGAVRGVWSWMQELE